MINAIPSEFQLRVASFEDNVRASIVRPQPVESRVNPSFNNPRVPVITGKYPGELSQCSQGFRAGRTSSKQRIRRSCLKREIPVWQQLV